MAAYGYCGKSLNAHVSMVFSVFCEVCIFQAVLSQLPTYHTDVEESKESSDRESRHLEISLVSSENV